MPSCTFPLLCFFDLGDQAYIRPDPVPIIGIYTLACYRALLIEALSYPVSMHHVPRRLRKICS